MSISFTALNICLILIAPATVTCLGLGTGSLLMGWQLKKNGGAKQGINKYLRQGYAWVAITWALVVAGVTIWLRDQYGNGWLALSLATLPLVYIVYWRKRRVGCSGETIVTMKEG